MVLALVVRDVQIPLFLAPVSFSASVLYHPAYPKQLEHSTELPLKRITMRPFVFLLALGGVSIATASPLETSHLSARQLPKDNGEPVLPMEEEGDDIDSFGEFMWEAVKYNWNALGDKVYETTFDILDVLGLGNDFEERERLQRFQELMDRIREAGYKYEAVTGLKTEDEKQEHKDWVKLVDEWQSVIDATEEELE